MTFARGIQDSVDELSTRSWLLIITFEAPVRLANCTKSDDGVRSYSKTYVIPFERNPLYLGRDSLLEQIHDMLLHETPSIIIA